jgi:hypothetical protein
MAKVIAKKEAKAKKESKAKKRIAGEKATASEIRIISETGEAPSDSDCDAGDHLPAHRHGKHGG